ncbi:MFS transporter [Glycomyces harbinensis]|uniref:Predicted arabinose efflux permease, MFS family n=1 Tax=Glycomyces harbinensis TaxID=58114 RepID=A0A1G7D298_9ACTN|nr:MFS transporter [Glycomyces harbinensis]SDE45651.1 Predicted arabinose efflux permease, MFS family [Glycomyces harbinensis]
MTSTTAEATTLGRAFWLLWLGWVVNRLGLLHPAFFALYLLTSGLTDATTSALAVAMQGAGSATASIVGGMLGDRVGPRRAISASQVGYAVVLGIMLVSSQIWLLVGLVFVAGFLAAINRPTGTAMVVNLVPESRRTRAFGLLYWANNVGGSVGPVLSGVLLYVAPRGIFVLGICTALVYWFICRFLPDDRVQARDTGVSGKWGTVRTAGADMAQPFLNRSVAPFLALSFLLNIVYLQRQSTLPIDMKLNGINEAGIGSILAVNAVLVIVLQPLAAAVGHRMKTLWMLVGGSALVAVGFGLNGFAESSVGFLVALSVWSLGEIIMAPAPATFIAHHAPGGRQSAFQGSYFFVLFLGMVVGAPLGVFLLERYGSQSAWTVIMVVGLLAAAGYWAHSRKTSYQ